MNINFKEDNTFEVPLKVRILEGKYIIKKVSIILTTDDPYDLPLLMKKQSEIEKELTKELNKGFSQNVSLPN